MRSIQTEADVALLPTPADAPLAAALIRELDADMGACRLSGAAAWSPSRPSG